MLISDLGLNVYYLYLSLIDLSWMHYRPSYLCISYFLVTLLFSLWNIAPSLLTFKHLPTICLSTYMVLSWLFSNICSNIGLSFWKCYVLWALEKYNWLPSSSFRRKKMFFRQLQKMCGCMQASIIVTFSQKSDGTLLHRYMHASFTVQCTYQCKTEICRYLCREM